MKLKRILTRYYPPGLGLHYVCKDGRPKIRELDILELTSETSDVDAFVDLIASRERLLTPRWRQKLKPRVRALVKQLQRNYKAKYSLLRTVNSHVMPLTNTAFNKSGSRFVTGSYDSTCKVWDTETGEELRTLKGHSNVVYAVAFNKPYSDLIATGSFDKSTRVWSCSTGKLHHTFRAHAEEVVCVMFDPTGRHVCSGSMDWTAKLFDVETGRQVQTLDGHIAEVVGVQYSTDGALLVTASFDHTVRLWDPRAGHAVRTLEGHVGEISCASFDFAGGVVVSASIDKTCKTWDVASGRCLNTFKGRYVGRSVGRSVGLSRLIQPL